jgi:hypothetical protein
MGSSRKLAGTEQGCHAKLHGRPIASTSDPKFPCAYRAEPSCSRPAGCLLRQVTWRPSPAPDDPAAGRSRPRGSPCPSLPLARPKWPLVGCWPSRSGRSLARMSSSGSSSTVAASVAQSATKSQRLLSGASPTVVAALRARGDTLIAIGGVAAHLQRAAALASARAAIARGRTYDILLSQAIGAIGVVAAPDAVGAW